eukprot:9484464-Pyramimonas_sp.AAC.1
MILEEVSGRGPLPKAPAAHVLGSKGHARYANKLGNLRKYHAGTLGLTRPPMGDHRTYSIGVAYIASMAPPPWPRASNGAPHGLTRPPHCCSNVARGSSIFTRGADSLDCEAMPLEQLQPTLSLKIEILNLPQECSRQYKFNIPAEIRAASAPPPLVVGDADKAAAAAAAAAAVDLSSPDKAAAAAAADPDSADKAAAATDPD